MNKCVLIGRLTRNVELRHTQSGKAVGNFTLAIDRPYQSAQGEKETDYIPIVVWGKLAEVCDANIGKGRLVAVSGRIQPSSFTDNEGNKRYKTEVIADAVHFLDWPKDAANETASKMDIGQFDDLPF